MSQSENGSFVVSYITRENICDVLDWDKDEVNNLTDKQILWIAYKMEQDCNCWRKNLIFYAKQALEGRDEPVPEYVVNHAKREFFPITSICRDDLESRGFDISNVTDAQMLELAGDMSNDYLTQLYWDSMDILAEEIGIPRKPETE